VCRPTTCHFVGGHSLLPLPCRQKHLPLEQALAQRETSFLVYKASVDIVENGWMYDRTIGLEDRFAMERTEGTYSYFNIAYRDGLIAAADNSF
jgi:hypothetical protein